MLTRDRLVRAAGEMGFPSASVEKVWILVRLLGDMASHPFWGPRMAVESPQREGAFGSMMRSRARSVPENRGRP